MQLHYFPFDLQHCRISLQSYSFPTSALQYSWASDSLKFQGENLSENVMPDLLLTGYNLETRTVRDNEEDKSQLDLVLHFSKIRVLACTTLLDKVYTYL